MSEPPMLFAVSDAAAVLGIGRTNVYALMRSGRLRSVKLGGRRLIPHQDLVDYIDRLRAEAKASGKA